MEKRSWADDVFYDVYRNLLEKYVERVPHVLQLYMSHADFRLFVQCACFPLVRKIWERILIIEMNFAEEDGLLEGPNEADRYAFFVKEVVKPENLDAIFRKYPGLWPIWQQQINTMVRSLTRFVSRIASDLCTVAEYFFGDKAVRRICSISMIGDPHNGMQQTARLQYMNESGAVRVVYYKPRNLAIDVGFHDFIAWWNSRAPIDHIVPRVFNAGEYGWAQGILSEQCRSSDEVRAFYRRYGSLVALAYCFCATDLHMENILANGEYPVVIDLETMFSCVLDFEKDDPLCYHLYNSLLLPTETYQGDIEISPLTAGANLPTDIEILVNPQKRTPSLKLEKRRLHTTDCVSQVICNGCPVDWLRYEEELCYGMDTSLLFLYENRQEVAKKISRYIGSAPVRIVKQSTEEYGKILYNLCHPDSLRRGTGDAELLALCHPSRDVGMMQSEIAELNHGDVPYFSVDFDATTLKNGCHQTLSTRIFRNPRQKFEQQLFDLTREKIGQVVQDARYAFFAYRLNQKEFSYEHKRCGVVSTSPDTRQWFDMLAVATLSRVMDCAQLIDGQYYWRDIRVDVGKERTHAAPGGIDLYKGTSGIALAFYVVGKRLACKRFLNFSYQLSQQIAQQLERAPAAEPGGLDGSAGILWALGVVNEHRLLDFLPVMDRELKKISYEILTRPYEHYRDIEFMGGISGTLSMLLRLHNLYQFYPISKDIASLAHYAFRSIVDKAEQLLDDATTSLGFAHGTAGVSASLAKYMRYFQQEDKRAIRIIRRHVERETFHRTDQGWPRIGKDQTCSTSWCHGTVGLGFSRLHCRPYIAASVYNSDIKLIQERLGEIRPSHGNCHGMMADYCLAKALGLDFDRILESLRQEITRSGIKTDFALNNFEIIGAMTGVTSLFTGEAIFLDAV